MMLVKGLGRDCERVHGSNLLTGHSLAVSDIPIYGVVSD